MHVEKLKQFIELYETRNFTKTAKSNFISQAALSQYVNSLEEQYGASFFDRSVTPIAPTPVGTTFYEEAKILYRQYLNMSDTLYAEIKEEDPPLRIGYTAPIDLEALIKYIPLIKSKNKNLKIKAVKVPIQDAKEYLTKNLCDIIISFANSISDKKIETLPLYTGNYSIIVSKTHPLAKKDSVTSEEAYKYPIVILCRNTIGPVTDAMLNRLKEQGITANIAAEVDDVESQIFYILAGDLVGFVPEKSDISQYKDFVKRVKLDDETHSFKVSLYYSKSNKSKKLLSSLNIIKNELP
ncbi:MAG: LysR family transcriptional regulator [Lachnospiraceae bacterium]|nr:LysR family transcriptional regulator [Lachnospiraceae bacterium]